MGSNKLFLTIAIIAFVASLAWVLTIVVGPNGLTGFSVVNTTTAVVNVTVNTNTVINFTTAFINFGAGSVNIGSSSATLTTVGSGESTGGSWTPNGAQFVLENIGNTNVTLELKSAKNAASFIGGTSPSYQYNITDAEAGSCVSYSGNSTWQDFITTGNGDTTCNPLRFEASKDTINVDIKLVIPEDSKTGALTDTITATGTF